MSHSAWPDKIGRYPILGIRLSTARCDLLECENEPLVIKRLKCQRTISRAKRRGVLQIHHPSIVSELEHVVDTASGIFGIVMPLVPGSNLSRLIPSDGSPWESVCAQCQQVCAGLHCLHAGGQCQCDTKPDNVLITPAGHPVIIDLDTLPIGHRLGAKSMHGTAGYCAPEQCGSGQAIMPSTDVFGLAATFVHVLSGHRAFPTNSSVDVMASGQLQPDLSKLQAPDSIVHALAEALRPNPCDRPASMLELAEALGVPLTCQCGTALATSSNFCGTCGRPAGIQPPRCLACGQSIPVGRQQCPGCSRAVSEWTMAVTRGSAQGRCFALVEGEYSFGRAIHPEDQCISREHVQVICNGSLTLKNLSPKNPLQFSNLPSDCHSGTATIEFGTQVTIGRQGVAFRRRPC